MKTSRILGILALAGSACYGQSTGYTNIIRQVQYYEDGNPTEHDMSVASSGQDQEALMPINPGGARFELWTFPIADLTTEHLLATTYVASYMPIATLNIITEDQTSPVPRTRADRPFQVQINLKNLLDSPDAPDAAKSVNFFHYTQSYGEGGVGVGLDRTQAIEVSSESIDANGDFFFPKSGVTDKEGNPIYTSLPVYYHSVPASDLTKARGEERFTIYSLEDEKSNAPSSELASQTVQIWPVADGSIAGITANQDIQFRMPELTLTLNDLYPSSTTYVQVYKGNPALGTVGTVVPGSALVINESTPQNRVLIVQNYDEVVTSDGTWTFELLTSTPFGIDRLDYVSINVDRKLDVRASVNTIE